MNRYNLKIIMSNSINECFIIDCLFVIKDNYIRNFHIKL